MKNILILAFALALPSLAAAQNKTIYGEDSRLDFYEVTDRAERAAMRSAVSLFRDTALAGEGHELTVKGALFGDERRAICPGQKFFEQRSAAFCSGTLIAPDLVLTAGHCMGDKNKPPSRCERTRFVFGYAVSAEGEATDTVAKTEVYSCSKVEIYANGSAGDYSVVRLDRPVRGRPAARLHAGAFPEVGSGIFTVGGPYGLPLKVVNDAVLRFMNREKTFFGTNLDTSGGNSGGGIFAASDGALIGVHTASWDPDLVEIPLPRGHGLPADDARVKAGKCKTITTLEQAGGNGKKGYVLSKIPGLTALLRGDSRGAEQEVVDMPVTDIPAERADLSRFGAFP